MCCYEEKLIKTRRDNAAFRKYTSVCRDTPSCRLFRKKRAIPSRIFLVAVHVFCYVIIKLAIAHRAFSSWRPSCPPRLFPVSSSTLNRIKVAEEKQAGINRAKKGRAPAWDTASPFTLSSFTGCSDREERDGGRKTGKKHMHSSIASVSSRSRWWVAEERCNRSNTVVNATRRRRCSDYFLSLLPPSPFSAIVFILKYFSSRQPFPFR